MSKLNELLANIAVFNQKVYNLHWNLEGPSFMLYHKMTEKTFQKFTEIYDQIAEKLVMGDEKPLATFKAYLVSSTVEEVEPKSFSQREVCEHIIKDLNTIEKIGLEVKTTHNTQPLLDEIFMTIDKERWVFQASLKRSFK